MLNSYLWLQICPSRFTARSSYVSHKQNVHADSKERHPSVAPFVDRETKKLQCDLCMTSFNRDLTFLIHRAAHTGEKPRLPCSHCDSYFETKELLKSHATKEHPHTLHCCPECPKKFTKKDSLKMHLTLHKYLS